MPRPENEMPLVVFHQLYPDAPAPRRADATLSETVAPRALKSDSGPEFVSHAILRWLTDAGIDYVLSDPGKPWQNGTDDSFNGKLLDECLTMEWFRNRQEALHIIEIWRRHYNEVRPHSRAWTTSPQSSSRRGTSRRQPNPQRLLLNNRVVQRTQAGHSVSVSDETSHNGRAGDPRRDVPARPGRGRSPAGAVGSRPRS